TISAVTGRHSNQLNYWAVAASSSSADLYSIRDKEKKVKDFFLLISRPCMGGYFQFPSYRS
ncbi:hypothetical protein, partial [Acidaminococcus fermentans]|uniref:hypothetical protein n=1 Tax=Acidaminococcus fermentans TaxID=905 RepID=UPI0024933863